MYVLRSKTQQKGRREKECIEGVRIARQCGRRMKFHILAVNMMAVTRTILAAAREANGQRRSRPTP